MSFNIRPGLSIAISMLAILCFATCKKERHNSINQSAQVWFQIPCYGLTGYPVAYIHGSDSGIYQYDNQGREILDSIVHGAAVTHFRYADSGVYLSGSDGSVYYSTGLNQLGEPTAWTTPASTSGYDVGAATYTSSGKLLGHYQTNYPPQQNGLIVTEAYDNITYDGGGNLVSFVDYQNANADHAQYPISFTESFQYYTLQNNSNAHFGSFNFLLPFPNQYSTNLVKNGYLAVAMDQYYMLQYTYTFNNQGYVRSVITTGGLDPSDTLYIFYDCDTI